ncbi:MAG: hypothetical protein WHX93_09815 [bacterium]
MSKENHKHTRSRHLAGMLTCLALFCFCLVMLYTGFVSVDIDCARKHTGEPPVCMIQEKRLLGLFNSRVSVSSVSNVSYQTKHSQARGRLASGSTVVLTGSNGSFPITQTMSNLGDTWKLDVVRKIDGFLKNPDEASLSVRVNERNIFGWVGVIMSAFLGLVLLYWLVKRFWGWV